MYVPWKALANVASIKSLCTGLNMPSNVRLLEYHCPLNIFICNFNQANVTNDFFSMVLKACVENIVDLVPADHKRHILF